jgi:hypothetical protein
MNYTPPAYNAADFSFVGAAAYTPPAATAVDFDFQDTTGAIVTGAGAAGIPQALALQQVAWATGIPALGTPEAIAWLHHVGWVLGTGAAGVPAVVGIQQIAWASGAPAAGAPAVFAINGRVIRILGEGAAGTPQALGTSGYTAVVECLPDAGTPQALAWALPAAADMIPPGVVHYFCTLTGAPDGLDDLVLPISNFSVRHRPDAPSYYSVTIPTYAYVTDLAARPNGQIVIWSEQSGITEELSRGDLGQVAIYRGPNSQSMTIDGNSDQAALPHLTYVLTDVLYVNSTFTGENRLRITPRAAIRPGDFVRYHDLNFEVGSVTWSVSVSASGMAATMELANLPLGT